MSFLRLSILAAAAAGFGCCAPLLAPAAAPPAARPLSGVSIGCEAAIVAQQTYIGGALLAFEEANAPSAGACDASRGCSACSVDCDAGLPAMAAACAGERAALYRQYADVRCGAANSLRTTITYVCVPSVCTRADDLAALLAAANATVCGNALAQPGVRACAVRQEADNDFAPAAAGAVTAAVIGTLCAVAAAVCLGAAVWRWARARAEAAGAAGEKVPMLYAAVSPAGAAALLSALQSAAAAATPPSTTLATSYARRAAHFGARTEPDADATVTRASKAALLQVTHGGLRPAVSPAGFASRKNSASPPAPGAAAGYYPPALEQDPSLLK